MDTKDVQVNRFRVRYGGEYYGPGQEAGNIIYDMPADIAESLIAHSNGTIVEIPKKETVAANKKGKGKSGNKEGFALGDVNPEDTVKGK